MGTLTPGERGGTLREGIDQSGGVAASGSDAAMLETMLRASMVSPVRAVLYEDRILASSRPHGKTMQPSAFSLQPSAFIFHPSSFILHPSSFILQSSAYSVSFLDEVCSSSQRKKGPPSKAVMTPTGISAGAATMRATVSHSVRKAPPKIRLAGMR